MIAICSLNYTVPKNRGNNKKNVLEPIICFFGGILKYNGQKKQTSIENFKFYLRNQLKIVVCANNFVKNVFI